MKHDFLNTEEEMTKTDEQIEKETMEMLKVLAENVTSKTQILAVEKGTWRWYYAVRSEQTSASDAITIRRYIKLYQFFGMVVGYSKEFDLLLQWTP